ncbi:hypothetical protein [Lacrimispora sp. 210928-DFI.3.58]|uniref:hypothetical protein n=1 Tax=Lacrimispora sp. 210928-DFI.3.58 TaxID=2883214 RepID=UPI001D07E13E|nr:hypothetical protein [Lacrimispora sp. 210928-DFI.3.58]MCB7318609.1 hypothetical protein [Lacrimispora sp. 210928-DFI.3.58]
MKQDLTGQSFGRLTVVEEEKRAGNHRYWRCRCTCGNETVVEESHLKSGHTKSCGCYRKVLPRRRSIDLRGHRYGRLTVLGPASEHDGRMNQWECLCDCGNHVVCSRDNLRSGNTQSCGCLGQEKRKENMKKAIHFVEGTCVERIACRRTCANNTSGHRGVYRRENNRWRASIGFQGKIYNLGSFRDYEDAVNARLMAEKELYDPFLQKYEKEKGQKEGK